MMGRYSNSTWEDSTLDMMSLTTILERVLSAEGWSRGTQGDHNLFINKSGAVLRIKEILGYCEVRGIAGLDKIEADSWHFPLSTVKTFRWYTTPREWEIIANGEYFYLRLGEKLYFFGTAKTGVHLITGRSLLEDPLFFTQDRLVSNAAYSNASSFSDHYTSNLAICPEWSAFSINWISSDGRVNVFPISVYDFRQEHYLCEMPGIWALSKNTPNTFGSSSYLTGNGKSIVIRKLEGYMFGIEV